MKSKVILLIHLISHLITFNILTTDTEFVEITNEDKKIFHELAEQLKLIKKETVETRIKEMNSRQFLYTKFGTWSYLIKFAKNSLFDDDYLHDMLEVLKIDLTVGKRFFFILDAYCKKAELKKDQEKLRLQLELQNKIRYADILYTIFKLFHLIDTSGVKLNDVLELFAWNEDLCIHMDLSEQEKHELMLKDPGIISDINYYTQKKVVTVVVEEIVDQIEEKEKENEENCINIKSDNCIIC